MNKQHWSWRSDDGVDVETTLHEYAERWLESVSGSNDTALDESGWFRDLSVSLLEIINEHMEENIGWNLLLLTVPESIMEIIKLKMADYFYVGRFFERAIQNRELDGD